MRDYRDRQRSVAQLRQHLAAWAEELLSWEIGRRVPIRAWEESVEGGAPRRLSLGDPWSDRHGLHRFRSLDPVAAPAGEPVELWLDLGGEALVRLAAPDGAVRLTVGANPRHRRTAPLPPGPFHVEAEAVGRQLFGQPVRAPRLALAELAWVEPGVRALRRRIEAVAGTMGVVEREETLARGLYETARLALARLRLPTATARAGERAARTPWAEGLWERSFDPVDAPADLGGESRASVEEATALLDEGLAGLRGRWPKQGKVLATGHAHIDYAWLWPRGETVRKIHRTFATLDHLLSAHEGMTFLASSSRHYAHVEETDPPLMERITAHVAAGRWEAIGGMVIEPDTNMPSAEAFLRQILHGQRWFQSRFGATHRTAWLPDTFGFTGALPQILRHGGLEAMVTIKVTWNETDALPDNLFRWVGTDGSEVLVHTFDAKRHDGYNMHMTPAALAEVWGNHRAADLTDTVIASYGWGDGGGGPDPDQVETVPVLNLMPAIPEVAHGSVQGHLDRLLADPPAALPAWRGEMYLEYHRATLTTQGRTKRLNRRAEAALVAAEAAAGLAALAGVPAPLPDLRDDWETLLGNQFHDILPGSSIREVHEEAEAALADVAGRGEAAARGVLLALAASRGGPSRGGPSRGGPEGIAVANLSGSAKDRWQVESPDPLPPGFAAQRAADGWVAAGNRPLAPLSVAFLAGGAPGGRVEVARDRLANGLVEVRLDGQGRIASILDRRRDAPGGRELLDSPVRLMLSRGDLPHAYDAWDLEAGHDLGATEVAGPEGWEVTAEGPHLGEVTVTRPVGEGSRIAQRLRLWANSARVEVRTRIDWHDRRLCLRALVPVTVLAEAAAFDQAIGVTWRATHANTSWQKAQFEGCGHRFVHMGEPGWGAALLSAGPYGMSAKGRVLGLTLVRGPLYPDMLADEGTHHLTWAILPTRGRWWDPEVQAEADLLADPLRVVPAPAGGPDVAPLGWEGAQLRLHALKPGAQGSRVLRVSEAAGRRGPVALRRPEGLAAARVDGLERPVEGAVDAPLRPFELRSIRLG